ncbi:MAG: hypothetical protein ACE5KT_00980 [Methanosarcinales archaeon]
MKVLITTVGASGYQNCNREKNIDNFALKEKIDAVYNFLKEKEDKDASAETNSLEKILEEEDFIYFLHSDTDLAKRRPSRRRREWLVSAKHEQVISVQARW